MANTQNYLHTQFLFPVTPIVNYLSDFYNDGIIQSDNYLNISFANLTGSLMSSQPLLRGNSSISGGLVKVESQNISYPWYAQTNNLGDFSLGFIPPDQYSLTTETAGFIQDSVNILLNDTTNFANVTFELNIDSSYSGPLNCSVEINSNDLSTNNLNVQLTLSAINATEMIIDEDINFIHSTWQPFNQNLNYTFIDTSKGTKTIFVKFRSSDLTESNIISDNIIFGEDNSSVINISSDISGADIFVNQLPISHITPYTMTNIPPGAYTISVHKSGFSTYPSFKLVTVEPNQTYNINFTLQNIPPFPPSLFTYNQLGDSLIFKIRSSSDFDLHSIKLNYRLDGIYPQNPSDGTLFSEFNALSDSLYEIYWGTFIEDTTYYFSAFSKDSANNYSIGKNLIVNTPHINSIPQIIGLADTTFLEDSILVLNLNNFVQDDDPFASLRWQISEIENVGEGKILNKFTNELIINYDSLLQTVTFSSLPNFYKLNIPIEFLVRDPYGAVDIDTILISILPVNDPPVVLDIPTISFPEDSTYSFDLDDYVIDVDDDTNNINWLFYLLTNKTTNKSKNKNIKFLNDKKGIIAKLNGELQFFNRNKLSVRNKLEKPTLSQKIVEKNSVYFSDGDSINIIIDPITHICQIIPFPNFWTTGIGIEFIAIDSSGAMGRDSTNIVISPINDSPTVVNPINDYVLQEDFAAFTAAELDTVFSDIDGDSLVYGAVSLGGNVTVQLNGSLVTLGSTPNYFGPETIVVSADDQVNRVVVSDTFVVIVTPVNDPPQAVADSATTSEDTPVTIPVLANDSDIENDPLSVASVTQGAHGSVTINPDSTVTYIPNANYNGADQFSYVVSDGNGGLDTAEVFVTILEENDPPQLSALPPVQKMEDELLLWPLVNWYPFVGDPDDPDSSLSWSFEQEDLVSLQQVGDTIRFQPVQNAFGPDSILVIVTDSQLSDSTTLLLEVLPVNDPPEITFTDSLFCNEDDSLSLWLDTCVVDVDDPVNALSWQVQILGAAQNPADSITVHYDPQTHIVTFIPDSNYTVSNVPVEVVVSDTSGAADSTVLSLTVVGVNDPPQFVGPLPQIVFAEDDSLIYPISNWFPFVYDPDDSVGALSYFLMPGATVQIQPGNASYFLSAPENWFGSDTLMLHISDGEYIDSAKIDVLVTPVNDPPVISDSLPDFFEFVNGDSVMLSLWEYVSDPETPDSLLNYSAGSDTSGLVIQYQSATGWLKLQAAQHFAGAGKLFIAVSDDSGAVASDTIAVMVNPNALDEWRYQIPKQFVLYQNYPNPFNPVTTIRFGVPKAVEVKIEVYNILGQKVAELLNRRMEPGYHEVRFNGAQLGSGIYIYRMQAENFQAVRKLLLVK